MAKHLHLEQVFIGNPKVWGTLSYSVLPLKHVHRGRAGCGKSLASLHTNNCNQKLLGLIVIKGVILGYFDSSKHGLNQVWGTIWGFPGGSVGKESAYNAGHLSLIPGLGRSLGEGNGQPTPVFLPGEFHWQRNLMGYSSWGHNKTDKLMRLLLSLWHDWNVECFCYFPLLYLEIVRIHEDLKSQNFVFCRKPAQISFWLLLIKYLWI